MVGSCTQSRCREANLCAMLKGVNVCNSTDVRSHTFYPGGLGITYGDEDPEHYKLPENYPCDN